MSHSDFSRNQLIVAMDHARAFGTVEGLEDPGRVIDAVIDAGADGIMTSFGVFKRYRERLIDRLPAVIPPHGGPRLCREAWPRPTRTFRTCPGIGAVRPCWRRVLSVRNRSRPARESA